MKRLASTLSGTAGVLLIFALPASGGVHYEDGFNLMQICQNGDLEARPPTFGRMDQAEVDGGVCIGYIMGVVDGIHTAETLSHSTILCEPNSVRAGQLKRIVRRFLEAHPEYLHRSAADVVSVALHEAFPCGKIR